MTDDEFKKELISQNASGKLDEYLSETKLNFHQFIIARKYLQTFKRKGA